MKKLLCAMASGVIALAASAVAAPIEFVPPNDTTGYASSGNDGFGLGTYGRGIGFTMSGDFDLDSIGLFIDLTSSDLNWYVSQIPSLTDPINRNVLASGSTSVATTGMEWIDIALSTLSLQSGSNYLIEFAFSGSADEIVFYFDNNIGWTQGFFTNLSGTCDGCDGFNNTVTTAFRVNGVGADAAVPVPAAALLFAPALGAVAFKRRKKA